MAPTRSSKRADARGVLDPTYESRIHDALLGVSNGTYSTLRQAAEATQVAYTTLKYRAQGRKSNKQAKEKQQALTPEEEQVVLDWAQQKEAEGTPFTLKVLRHHAELISGKSLGLQWARRYLSRHPILVTAKPVKLDPKRADHFNRTVVNDFFEKWQNLLDERGGIPPEHIWNMDEKGIQLGGGRKNGGKRYLFSRNSKQRYRIASDNLELVTVLECVSAAGNEVPPSFVLTEGQVPDLRKLVSDDLYGSICTSPSGWTDTENCRLWISEVFFPRAKKYHVDNTKPIVLFVDGHETHEAHPIIQTIFERMDEMEVVLFCFPSKCTHKLQPLDVGIFSGVQREWQNVCDDAIVRNWPINRFTVIPEYIKARSQCLTKNLISSAFSKTGICPINPDVFTDKDFAPSNVTSSKAHVPKSFPPEVRSSSPAIPTDSEEREHELGNSSDFKNMDSDSDTEYFPREDLSPSGGSVISLADTETVYMDQHVNETEDLQETAPADLTISRSLTAKSGLLKSLQDIQFQAKDHLHYTRSMSSNAASLTSKSPPVVSFKHDSILPRADLLIELRKCRERLLATYQEMEKYKANAQAAHAHCTLLKQELEDIRGKLTNERTKKTHGTSCKSMARFHTSKNLRAAFEKKDAERIQKEKNDAEKQKKKEVENTARENRIAINSVMQIFSKPLTTLKIKEDFQSLARAFNISATGTKNEILSRIKVHMEENPELQNDPRFSGLFLQPTRRHQLTAQSIQPMHASPSNYQTDSYPYNNNHSTFLPPQPYNSVNYPIQYPMYYSATGSPNINAEASSSFRTYLPP